MRRGDTVLIKATGQIGTVDDMAMVAFIPKIVIDILTDDGIVKVHRDELEPVSEEK